MAKIGNSLKKVKNRRIKWREVIFHLHRRDLSDALMKFRNNHPKMSVNRCAYNVIKTFYSTTTVQMWKYFFEHTLCSYERLVQPKLVQSIKWC